MSEETSEGRLNTESLIKIIEDDFYQLPDARKRSPQELIDEISRADPGLAKYIQAALSRAPGSEVAELITQVAYVTYHVAQYFAETQEVVKEKIIYLKEPKPLPKNWNYEHFRQYLLALPRGKEFLLHFDQYPESIELDVEWHKTLNGMRRDSQDEIERYAVIGFKEVPPGLFLPDKAAKGLADYVPEQVLTRELQRAKATAKIVDIVGDIHSHPRKLRNAIWGDFLRRFGLKKDFPGAFSAGDLYRIVVQGTPLPFVGVVDGEENIFAFRTRESTDIGLSSSILNQDSFEKYWYERNGFKYLGSFRQYGARRAEPLTPDANNWGVNMGIAQRHQLVLYKGLANQNLQRAYPQAA